MKIVISGYGRMGHEIEEAARHRGHEIVATVDRAEDWETNAGALKSADVVIEFSTPGTVIGNIRKCFDLGLPVVVGTTGWNQHAETVREWCHKEGQAVFTAANYSIGVNIMFRLARELGGMLDRLEAFDVSIEEIHHIHKLDAPSGTAIRLAEILLDKISRKESWVKGDTSSPEKLPIVSRREGEISGTHILRCRSDYETLTLVHEAHNRKGFALGAVMAAEWMEGKKGFFGMDDLLQL